MLAKGERIIITPSTMYHFADNGVELVVRNHTNKIVYVRAIKGGYSVIQYKRTPKFMKGK